MTTAVPLTASLAAVVLLGINAGIHICGVAALNPALRLLDAQTYVAVKQSTDRQFPALMRPLTLVGLAALLTQTVAGGLYGYVWVSRLAAVGLLAAIIGLVAVLRGDQPINGRMAQWDRSAPPADWSTWRTRWEGYFWIRTVATAVAFLAALAGLVALP